MREEAGLGCFDLIPCASVSETAMARRQIGQEQLVIGGEEPRGTSLDEVSSLVDGTELDCLLAGISASPKGELGWPPLALF